MRRWILLLVCLIGAVICYLIGFGRGIFVIAAFGIVLELAFWLNVIKGRPKT
ncbi:hypothetical protein [Alteromonas gilva]|uniref:Phosphatidate cytidylyltransferase n=1 Tax=Alteromonas gilva TaxID=2987522 RepID=A0ABT5L6J5_9ALTE|nr:hypothetical protein [Alteromonas gilva]MDC8832029.1 hypothetical protein [Alteromonas gilva]